MTTYEIIVCWATFPKSWDLFEGIAVSVCKFCERLEDFANPVEAHEALKAYKTEVKPDGDFIRVTEYAVIEVCDGEDLCCVEITEFPKGVQK